MNFEVPRGFDFVSKSIGRLYRERRASNRMADEKKSKIPAKDIHQLLQQLALSSPQEAGNSKKEGKAPQDYKFWTTQPVPQFDEKQPPNLLQTTDDGRKEGPILPDEVCRKGAKAEPEKLVDGFEWTRVDLDRKDELQELYDLLFNHYVEDTEGSFRFNYAVPFLQWALKPPGWKKEWHVGVRTKPAADGKKGKLVAFISAIPATVAIHERVMKTVEINFLAVHRKLRLKRLTPVMIKEITRQCYLTEYYQALYTGGILLPVPFTTCRYFHRALDWPYLFKMGFSAMPPRSSETQQVRKYYLPSKTETKGLRLMKKEDIPAVGDLLNRYLKRFQLRQEFDLEETEHVFCSEASKGVVWSYVVEQEGKITDFISYYLLEVGCTWPS